MEKLHLKSLSIVLSLSSRNKGTIFQNSRHDISAGVLIGLSKKTITALIPSGFLFCNRDLERCGPGTPVASRILCVHTPIICSSFHGRGTAVVGLSAGCVDHAGKACVVGILKLISNSRGGVLPFKNGSASYRRIIGRETQNGRRGSNGIYCEYPRRTPLAKLIAGVVGTHTPVIFSISQRGRNRIRSSINDLAGNHIRKSAVSGEHDLFGDHLQRAGDILIACRQFRARFSWRSQKFFQLPGSTAWCCAMAGCTARAPGSTSPAARAP